MQDLDGNPPKPLTPPGTVMNGAGISPDGLHVAATASDGRLLVYTLNRATEAGEERYIPGVSPGERSIRWATGGRAIYVYQPEGLPVRIYRVDVTTGKREPVREFTPSNPLGVYSARALVLSEDGRTAVYGFQRITSELFLAEGLK